MNSPSARSRDDKRRPAGISRRRKRQLGFESLEDRRVMSAQSPLVPLADLQSAPMQDGVSYSSSSLAGQLAILENELYWQALTEAATNRPNEVAKTLSIPTDPLVQYAWHLINSGQQVGNPDFQNIFGVPGEDINVAPVWNMGYTGAGVTVAVFDSGVELLHPDLVGNISTTIPGLDALGLDNNANPRADLFDPSNAHGTAVAGIIGAVAGNGIGSSGIAPGVTLVPVRLIDPGDVRAGLEQPFVDAFRYRIQDIDITNNSWGPAAIIRGLAGPTANELLALRDSVIFGRGGLGVIHVFSAGNDAGSGAPAGFTPTGLLDTSSYNGWINSRYTIGVTGVDHDGYYNNVDGSVTSYPATSASVLVAAPTGSNAAINLADDTGIGSGIYTTDLTGSAASGLGGFNTPPEPSGQELDRDFLDDSIIPNSDGYTSRFNGTSASAPMVTGVIALMLQANPNLTWRDVQEILVRSARQNAQFDVPQTGADVGFPQETTQNLWIINQKPVFHDPDPYLPNVPVDPLLRLYFPTLNPNITGAAGILSGGMHYQATPIELTNGAGYTISQGRGAYGEQIGYAHGAVDALMAVQLAEQWTTKGQALPSELTFSSFITSSGNRLPAPGPDGTNLPASERGNDDTGNIYVPGSLGGEKGFINFWNEYYADNPEFGGPGDPTNSRGTPIYFSVPDSNAMTVENVELKVSISGGTAAALDNLRILLISPDGTHSELNNYYLERADAASQNSSPFDFIIDGVSGDNGGQMVWTFSTNRSWGERSSDALVIDPVTNEPIVNTTGVGVARGWVPTLIPETIGTPINQSWQIHFENYGSTDLNLDGMEIVWHGSPIAAASKRVQGFVGIDENGDDAFNYGRTISANIDLDQSGALDRYGEINNIVDLEQEQFAGNVTVSVHRTSDGSLVDQFVTGHDGNFYFDLVPDDYTISIDDPLGRVGKDDGTTGAQFLRHFKSEWQITEDYFRAWDHDAVNASEVLVDNTGTPLNWVDGNGNAAVSGIKGINFLLDPGAPVAQQAEFTGAVYADVNGDGVYNGDDVYLPNTTVYGDVNRNGVRDSGEVTALTDAQGKYTLVVPITASTVLNVGIVAPTGWTATKPVTTADPNASIFTKFSKPGDEFALPDFSVKPPANNTGTGNLPGILLGVVYNDKAGTGAGSRQAGEQGAANVTVFIDANNNGTLEATETKFMTNDHGAFVFTNVSPGQKVVRMVVNSPMIQTAPNPGLGRVVTLAGSSTISNIQFGARNTALYDFGDLPLIYGATLASQDGARHKVGGYYLGAPGSNDIDAELDGQPSANADGDDNAAPGMDEDGITFGTISPGATVQLTVQASQSGYLQGWVDWNNDGDFTDVGERVLTDKGLVAGANSLTISVPAGANVAQVYSRFRFGAFGINSIKGEATFGEVEDYQLNVAIPVVQQTNGMPADANGDGFVNGNDFLMWQRNVGRTTAPTQAQGDFNGDDVVNSADLGVWKGDYGDGAQVAAAAVAPPASADFDGDGDVDGDDFLLLQRGLGLAHPSQGAGDANHDGTVNSADLGIWRQNQGTQAVGASFVAEASAASSTAVTTSLSSGRSIAASVADAALVDQSAADSSTAAANVRAALSGRPFAKLTGDAQGIRSAVQQVIRTGRDAFDQTVAHLGAARERLADADFRRDRAFEDLLGSRRRQGLRVEEAADESGAEADCDAAFAALADHFDWTAT